MTSAPTGPVRQRPGQIFKPNALLGWSFAPDSRIEVPFREGVAQTIGADGWRNTPGTPAEATQALGIYGCSFVYGTGLADTETFAARLQAQLPETRVLNRGIAAQGTVQSYLQFRRDLRQGVVGAAIFGVISDHRLRNTANPERMKSFQSPAWFERGLEHMPVARLLRDGGLRIDYVPCDQPLIAKGDLSDFLPDDAVLDQVLFGVLTEIEALAKHRGVPVTLALLDRHDPVFNTLFARQGEPYLDISVPFDEAHFFIPLDLHPNAHANAIYADRLMPLARRMLASGPGR
jgi:hypothetical protein